MAYVIPPPPSAELMLEDFADWMAQHARAKVTIRFDYRDGTHTTTEMDRRGPMPNGNGKRKTPNAGIQRPASAGPLE